MNFTFNNQQRDYIRILRGFSRTPWAPIKRNIIYVPGMPGGHLSSTETEVGIEQVPVEIRNNGFESLERLKEDLADWLITEEPAELIFDDEPDRVYFAVVEGSLDFQELIEKGKGVITFLYPRPYKYGKEKEAIFPTDAVALTNDGTVEAEPIFELAVLKPVTFAMIQNQLG
ncbi:distal tail protein Dit, partial [Sutcliffiella cohnii]